MLERVFLGSGASDRYWLALLSSGASDVGLGVAVDASNNIYVGGSSVIAASDDIYLAQISSSGTMIAQKYFSGSFADRISAVAVDLSGNIGVCGETYVSGNPNFWFAISCSS